MKDLFAIGTVVVIGIIVADVLTHPEGTKAAGGALNDVLKTSFTAMLGSVPR